MNPTIVPLRTTEKSRTAILFIHGYSGHTTETWGAFPNFLLGHVPLQGWDAYAFGYPTNLTPDVLRGIWSASPDLETLAAKLQTELDMDPLQRYERVVFVAHSMGGLVVQKAMLAEEVADRCHAILLFGTPSGGLRKAWLVRLLKRQFRDMSPKSAFISQLRHGWKEAFESDRDFVFVAAAGDRDEFVPRQSSLDPFPQDVRAVVSGDHLGIVKPLDPDHASVRLVTGTLTKGALDTGPLQSARLAVEQGEFRSAIEKFEGRADTLDDAALVQYAIALDRMDRRQEAIHVLRKHGRSSTDAMGTLAGRLKRRWTVDREAADAKDALKLYRQAYEQSMESSDYAQAFYQAINVGALSLLYDRDQSGAKKWARLALRHCDDDEKTRGRPDIWRTATRGEAHLVLGDLDASNACYRCAVEMRPEPWQILSMMDQAMEIAEAMYEEAAEDRLFDIFQGH